jgi:FixJ family two-component response regulator
VDDSSCIIVDVQMRGMSGLELQQILRARGDAVPIIFVTAFADDERLRERLLAGGAFCVLGKPFADEGLIRCLGEALQGDRDA